MNRKLVEGVILIIFIVASAHPQKVPDWVENEGLSLEYPSSLYMIGFGLAEDKSMVARKGQAEAYAKADLSGQFLQRIKNEIYSSEQVNTGKVTLDFRNIVTSVSQLNLLGVRTYWHDDREKNLSYALAVMEIDAATEDYTNHIVGIIKELDDLLKAAKGYEDNGHLKEAIGMYKRTFPLYIQAGEAYTILNILNRLSPFAENVQVPTPAFGRREVEVEINNLLGGSIASVEDAAYSLAEQFKGQISGNRRVVVVPFSYRDTDFSSAFAQYFLHVLRGELIPEFSIVTEQPERGIESEAVVAAPRFDSYIRGNLWEEGSNLNILTTLSDLKSGTPIGTASVGVPLRVLNEKELEYKPANMMELMEDTRIFLQNDVIRREISIEVWTDKGDRDLIFRENEETNIYVRVNKPCFLQVIYHMANGVRLLFYNNLYVDASKVNQLYTLPDRFYFVPPLGVERLQIFANQKEFDRVAIETATYDGEIYDNVFAEDIREYTARMRGMKKISGKAENTDITLTVTTIK